MITAPSTEATSNAPFGCAAQTCPSASASRSEWPAKTEVSATRSVIVSAVASMTAMAAWVPARAARESARESLEHCARLSKQSTVLESFAWLSVCRWEHFACYSESSMGATVLAS